ncbi:Polysaccharide pyruvyl transferase, partial [Methylobacterium phyllostachyos]
MKSRIKYWTKDENVRNFGDSLSEFLASELFLDIEDNGPDVHLIGSVISDGFVPPPRLDQDGREIEGPRVTFWGCGIRQPESLTLQNYENVELLAVRGPVSASDLRLGASVPTGDPALLLPALYEPRMVQRFAGRRICIPHFHEKRSDRELLDLCGCELVLRPNIAPGNDAIKSFIDALCSASFVLTASLHGAITAAAYGRPFAFWNIGWLDLPTKWQDTAALLNIPFQLCTTVEEAETFFREEVVQNYRRPPTWQLLSRAPFPLKPVALLKVLDYELRAEACGSEKVGEFLSLFTELSSHFDRLAVGINERRARRWASLGRDVDRARGEAEHARDESVALRSQVDNLSAELEAARTEAAALHERLRAHVAQSEQAAAEAASRT